MFSDLKRHDMGPGLAETTGGPLDPMFVTARLWGIADTAPYLHDGRALTLTDAILLHAGAAQSARDGFAALGSQARIAVLSFLRSLRTPKAGRGGPQSEPDLTYGGCRKRNRQSKEARHPGCGGGCLDFDNARHYKRGGAGEPGPLRLTRRVSEPRLSQ